jgi:hypothetical protein
MVINVESVLDSLQERYERLPVDGRFRIGGTKNLQGRLHLRALLLHDCRGPMNQLTLNGMDIGEELCGFEVICLCSRETLEHSQDVEADTFLVILS